MNVRKHLSANIVIVKVPAHGRFLTSWTLKFKRANIIIGYFPRRSSARDYKKKYIRENIKDFHAAVKHANWMGCKLVPKV